MISAVVLGFVAIVSIPESRPYEILDREREIALAKSAGLSPWNEEATIYVLGPEGYSDLIQIEVRPGVPVTPENLFEARLDIVRTADLEEGRTRTLHEDFFDAVTRGEESLPV